MFVPEPVLQQFSSGVLRAMVRDAVVLSRSDSVLWAGECQLVVDFVENL